MLTILVSSVMEMPRTCASCLAGKRERRHLLMYGTRSVANTTQNRPKFSLSWLLKVASSDLQQQRPKIIKTLHVTREAAAEIQTVDIGADQCMLFNSSDHLTTLLTTIFCSKTNLNLEQTPHHLKIIRTIATFPKYFV